MYIFKLFLPSLLCSCRSFVVHIEHLSSGTKGGPSVGSVAFRHMSDRKLGPRSPNKRRVPSLQSERRISVEPYLYYCFQMTLPKPDSLDRYFCLGMASESLSLSSGGSDAEGLGYEEHRSGMDVVNSYGRPGTVSSDDEAETDTDSERTLSGGSPRDDPDYQVGEEEGDGEEEVEVVNADDDEEGEFEEGESDEEEEEDTEALIPRIRSGDGASSSQAAGPSVEEPVRLIQSTDPEKDEGPNPYLHYFNTPEGIEEFRGLYLIPDDVFIRRVNRDDIEHGPDHITVPIMAITKGGLRFPIGHHLREFFRTYNLSPFQLALNSFRIINSALALSRKELLPFHWCDLLIPYYVNSNKTSGRRFFSMRKNHDHIVRLPDADKRVNDFIEVSGNYNFPPGEKNDKTSGPVPMEIRTDTSRDLFALRL